MVLQAQTDELIYLDIDNKDDAILNVDESIGAIFVRSKYFQNGHLNYYIRASRQDSLRDILREMINLEEYNQYWTGMIRMLGYVGIDKDVVYIEKFLLKDFPKKNFAVNDAARSVFTALEKLIQRGSNNASLKLKAMISYEYWEKHKLSTNLALNDRAFSPIDNLRILALQCYHRANQKDGLEQIQLLLKDFGNSKSLIHIKSYFEEKRLAQARLSYTILEQKTISDSEKKEFNDNFKKVKENLLKNDKLKTAIYKAQLEDFETNEIEKNTLKPNFLNKKEPFASNNKEPSIDVAASTNNESSPFIFILKIVILILIICTITILLSRHGFVKKNKWFIISALVVIIILSLLSINYFSITNDPSNSESNFSQSEDSTEFETSPKNKEQKSVESSNQDENKSFTISTELEVSPKNVETSKATTETKNKVSRKSIILDAELHFDIIKKDLFAGTHNKSVVGFLDGGFIIDPTNFSEVRKAKFEGFHKITVAKLKELSAMVLIKKINIKILTFSNTMLTINNDEEFNPQSDIVVTWELYGSSRIILNDTRFKGAIGHLGPFGIPTIDKKGNLIVFMYRKNGRWYWNPFGW